MPTSPVSNNPLVVRHHAAMAALNESLKRALRSPQLLRMDKTSAKYADAVAALVQEFASASASLTADYYEDVREAAGITTPYRVPAPEDLPVDRVGESLAPAKKVDPKVAQSQVESIAGLLVTSTGKSLLISAIMGDDKAKKWARVTRPGACAFCRMLATRGPVYKSDKTASFIPHPGPGKRGGVCQCTIEAVFHPESYEPTAATRADQKLYNDATAHVAPGEQLNAFRRAIAAQNRGEVPVFAKARPNPLARSQADQFQSLLGSLPKSRA